MWDGRAYFQYMPRSGTAGYLGRTIPNFLRNCHLDFQSSYMSLFSHQKWRSVPLATSCAVAWVLDLRHSNGYKMESQSCFDLYIPEDEGNQSYLSVFLGHSRYDCLSLYSIFSLGYRLLSNFLSSIYIYMDILPLSDVQLVKIFFLLWIFSVSWGPTYEMLIVVPGILFRKLPRLPMFPKLLSLSSIRYSVSNFMLMSLIHLDLSYVQANKHGSIWIVLYADIQLDHDTCWMCSPLFHCMVLASSSKRKCQ